jgi:hypothetical protein
VSVGTELLNEIERVSAKRERWRGYCKDTPSLAPGMQPAMLMMGMAIDAAKKAIADNDAVASIRALESLRGFDSDD